MAIETDGVKFVISVIDDSTKALATMHGHFKAFADASKRTISGISGGFSRLGSAVTRLGHRLRWLAAAGFAAATGAAYGLARGIIGATTEAETLRAQMQTLFGAQWRQNWDWAVKFAATTPFQLPEIIEAMSRLQAYDINPIETMQTIGDYSAAMGRNIIDLVEAVADAVMGEWERMKEFGIKRDMLEAWMAARGMGNAFNRMGQIVNAPLMRQGLFAMMAERGGGGMARMMDTIAGKWSNLKDAAWRFFVEIGDRIAPVLKRVLDGFINIIEGMRASDVPRRVAEWFARIFSVQNIQRAILAVGTFINIIRQLPGQLGNVWKFLLQIFGNLEEFFRRLGYNIRYEIVNALNDIATYLNNVIDAINAITEAIYRKLHPVKSMFGTGEPLRMPDEYRIPRIGLQPLPTPPPFQPYNWTWPGGGLDTRPPKWAQDMADQFGKQTTLLDNILNAATKTAANTGALVDRTTFSLSDIYGGGTRAKFLSNRLLFGGQGQSQHIIIDLTGGDDHSRRIAEQVVDGMLRQMQIPHIVRS